MEAGTCHPYHAPLSVARNVLFAGLGQPPSALLDDRTIELGAAVPQVGVVGPRFRIARRIDLREQRRLVAFSGARDAASVRPRDAAEADIGNEVE
jgi:hypothetical protein